MGDQIRLADYLTELRGELAEAQARAAGDSLKLGLEQITLALDVGYTVTKGGEVSAGVKAKFWVLELGEAAAKGTLSSAQTATQHLTLTLKPRVEQVLTDPAGRSVTTSRGVDVAGELEGQEESPSIPNKRR